MSHSYQLRLSPDEWVTLHTALDFHAERTSVPEHGVAASALLARVEALEPRPAYFCRCCGEESPTGRDCCADDFAEARDLREWA